MIVKRTSMVTSTLSWSLLITMFVIIFLPIMWMISTSLRLTGDSWNLPPDFFPRRPFLWSNYREVFVSFPFFRQFQNSLVISSLAVTGQLIASGMAAFALARINFRGSSVVLVLILVGIMVPSQVTIIPLFIIMRFLGLYNTAFALILPHQVFPVAVFLMRQFIMTIPKDYDEVGAIEGLGRFRIFRLIILPMIKPAVLVAAIMHLLIVWNDFFRPLVLLRSLERMTLPIGLYQLRGHMGSGSMSVVLAGVVLSVIPPLLFFIIGQKYLMMGLESGGLKF